MKKQQITKEELRQIEYEFGEYKQLLPEEIADLMEKSFELLRPYIEIELPMYEDLKVAIDGLIQHEFSWMDAQTGTWWKRWLSEIAECTAKELSVTLTILVYYRDKKTNRRDLYDDFEKTVAFYTKPREAHKRELPDWTGEQFWDELNDEKRNEILEEFKKDREEEYEYEKSACETYNKRKNKFIQTVQPILFKYIEAETETFDTEMWQHYGVTIGSVFYNYEENCSNLECAYDKEELTEDPGLDFHTYYRQFCEKHYPTIYPPTQP
jgi:hypothetical protein